MGKRRPRKNERATDTNPPRKSISFTNWPCLMTKFGHPFSRFDKELESASRLNLWPLIVARRITLDVFSQDVETPIEHEHNRRPNRKIAVHTIKMLGLPGGQRR